MVANLSAPIELIRSCMCRSRNGFRFVFLFNWRKSKINQILLSFFGIANKGASQSELDLSERNPILIKRCTSFLKSCCIACETRYAFLRNGLTPSTKSMSISGPFHATKFNCKSSLLRVSIFNKACCCVSVRLY